MLTAKTVQILKPYVEVDVQEIEQWLEQPPRPEMGDVAFPCFALAKQYKKSPAVIASELASSIQHPEVTVEASGPYVNFFFQRSAAAASIFTQINNPDYGKLSIGKGKKVVIDMSSPNIAKPFGVGHLRSTVIGAALYRMYKKAGYSAESVNHLGDWGTQFGKQITAYKRWGDDQKLKEEPIKESLRLYVKFHDEEENDRTLAPEAREWFRKLEQGDEEAVRLWNYFVEISMQEFDRMYERLGVKFDHTLGESFYIDKTDGIVAKLKDANLLIESDEALVVPLEEEGMPPCLIIKQDGTTIYPTRDLATAFYRREVMGADEILYVVGAEQKLHFQQVFTVLNKLGESWATDCIHVSFGLMKFEGRKMSTRKGKVVFLEKVLDEAVQRALEIIKLKNPNLPNAEEVAEQVGIGAIVFGDLKNNRINEVDFSLEEALSFEGETGPYVQYTYARIQSLLTKAEQAIPDRNTKANLSIDHLTISDTAWNLIKHLSRYPAYLEKAVCAKEPSVLAKYVIDTAQMFNRFYHHERILDGSPQELEYKLTLAQVTAKNIQQILSLLGIKTPERM